MSISGTRVAYAAMVKVTDGRELLIEFEQLVGAGTVQSALMHFLTAVEGRPTDSGYRIERRSLDQMKPDTYLLKVTATVFDENRFREAAIGAADACFNQGKEMVDAPRSTLLAELVTISNSSPSPSECGYMVLSTCDAEPHPEKVKAGLTRWPENEY